jgi:hypothetical protein
MGLFVTGIVLLLGLSTNYVTSVSSELTAGILLDADAGVDSAGSLISPDVIVDMRPETAITNSAPKLPDMLSQGP